MLYSPKNTTQKEVIAVKVVANIALMDSIKQQVKLKEKTNPPNESLSLGISLGIEKVFL